MATYGDIVHDIIRSLVLSGYLSNMSNRFFFNDNFILFINVQLYVSRPNAFQLIHQKYIDNYQQLILDNRFKFHIKSYDNIGVYATEDIYIIGDNIFIGAFTKQLTAEEANNHPSCVQRQILRRTRNNNIVSVSQYWILVGSIALLNHACNNCAKVKPYDIMAINEEAHFNSCFRVVSQIETIFAGEEICISYSDNDTSIHYRCSICNH